MVNDMAGYSSDEEAADDVADVMEAAQDPRSRQDACPGQSRKAPRVAPGQEHQGNSQAVHGMVAGERSVGLMRYQRRRVATGKRPWAMPDFPDDPGNGRAHDDGKETVNQSLPTFNLL